MASLFSPIRMRTFRPCRAQLLAAALGFALLALVLLFGPYRLLAQIEGDRGIAPLATTSDIQSSPVEVETTGKTAEEARLAGWKLAQSKAWEALKGPKMSDDQIDGMVSAVVIEHEQIGPRRYIATLSIIFDRTKAGPLLGVDTQGGESKARSAPLLVIPVLYSGGASQVFEVRGPWQKAWANFNTGSSAVDYVRPSGEGGQSLILTAGQPSRRSRLWWRTVLDQFDAADVIMPVARLERQWPGGPVRGTFTARYGPDNTYLDSFTLSANDEKGLPAMLDQAVARLDRIYNDALDRGVLKPDPTLVAEQHALDSAMAALLAATRPDEDETAIPDATATPGATPAPQPSAPVVTSSAITIQFASPDAHSVDSALGAVRGVSGVQGASTSSIAIGGTSVMRVNYGGDIAALAAALRARGWQVSVGSNALSIRR
jgi:hypothetical protein